MAPGAARSRTSTCPKRPIEAGLLAPGAKLVATFHGQEHTATVEDDGHLRLANGSSYANPSGASNAIAGYETNGWKFWKVPDGDKRVRLADLRAKLKSPA